MSIKRKPQRAKAVSSRRNQACGAGGGIVRTERASAVDLATVSHFEDHHGAGLVVDRVDESVGTLSDAIPLLVSG
jgi:hypothetical protein